MLRGSGKESAIVAAVPMAIAWRASSCHAEVVTLWCFQMEQNKGYGMVSRLVKGPLSRVASRLGKQRRCSGWSNQSDGGFMGNPFLPGWWNDSPPCLDQDPK
jgi:hypothetical protein